MRIFVIQSLYVKTSYKNPPFAFFFSGHFFVPVFSSLWYQCFRERHDSLLGFQTPLLCSPGARWWSTCQGKNKVVSFALEKAAFLSVSEAPIGAVPCRCFNLNHWLQCWQCPSYMVIRMDSAKLPLFHITRIWGETSVWSESWALCQLMQMGSPPSTLGI